MRKQESHPWKLLAAVSHPGSTSIGKPCTSDPNAPEITVNYAGPADAVIDFSTPQGTLTALQIALNANAALLIATTGLPDSTLQQIDHASQKIPIIIAPNTSAGVTILLDTIRTITHSLGPETRVEIVETHHKHKKDAPSGTALAMSKVVEQAGAVMSPDQCHSMRGGGVIGEHMIRFFADDEYLEVRHVATSRNLFAAGAIRAACWLTSRKKQPGLYTMMDVIRNEGC